MVNLEEHSITTINKRGGVALIKILNFFGVVPIDHMQVFRPAKFHDRKQHPCKDYSKVIVSTL
jgi:hypothetical protein